MRQFFSLPGPAAGSPAKRGRRSYVLAYTLMFCLFAGVICLSYAIQGKSFIWGTQADGMRQHYLCLAYYGEFLRSLPSKIFLEHTLPMWDFQMGYGSDILTTLHYYTVGDPLNLLSALVPAQYTEYLYDFLILLRMYLAGAAFSAYCLFRGNRHIPTLLGSAIYVFSGWVLMAGLKHPFFINPCIYFPLLLLGVEKIFKKNKAALYVCMVTVSALSNFYFFYMMGLLVILYGAFRYFTLFRGRGRKHLGHFTALFAFYSVGGILLAMPVLLPVLTALGETGRLNAEPYVPAFYSLSYYLNLLPAMFGKFQSHHTILGVAVICLPGIAVLFLRKGRRAVKAGFLLLLGLLCIPFAGHVMNGFSYATNRFSWAMVLLLSCLFVKAYPVMFRLKKKKHLLVAGCFILYAVYVAAVPAARNAWSLSTAVISAAAGLIFLFARLPLRKNRSLQFLFAFTVMSAGIFVNMWFLFTPKGNPKSCIGNFVDSGAAYSAASDSLSQEISGLDGIQDYRFEQIGTYIQNNSSLLTRLNSGQYFYSMVNGNLNRYQQETGFNRPYEQRMQNQNGRAFLMKLASMRYFAGRERYLPYGYEKLEELDAPGFSKDQTIRAVLAEDPNALPFAYTYDRYIPAKAYQSMSMAARQQAMLQGVVLEESTLPVCTPEDLSREIPYEIVETDGVKATEGHMEVTKPGATLSLSFKGLPACETYAVFEGLHFRSSPDARGKTETIGYLDISGTAGKNQVSRRLSFISEKNNFYSGRTNFIGNLGYQKKAFPGLTITFSEKGSYSFDSFTVCCQPMERLNEYASQRKANIYSLPEFSANTVRLKTTLDKSRAIAFSIPYSKGWSAQINGEDAEVKQANTLYMAVEARPGDTEIVLRYRTPGLMAGLALCFGGILFLYAGNLVLFFKRSQNLPHSSS